VAARSYAKKFQPRDIQNETGNIPKPNLSLRPKDMEPDWTKRIWGTPEQFDRVSTEWDTPEGLSNYSIEMLQKGNIKPNEIVDFIKRSASYATPSSLRTNGFS
jgi:hypothetical protein